MWQSLETIPNKGTFLIAVWEGDWNDIYKRKAVYEATNYIGYGLNWAQKGFYRTEEGQAYKVVGWMPIPEFPEKGK